MPLDEPDPHSEVRLGYHGRVAFPFGAIRDPELRWPWLSRLKPIDLARHTPISSSLDLDIVRAALGDPEAVVRLSRDRAFVGGRFPNWRHKEAVKTAMQTEPNNFLRRFRDEAVPAAITLVRGEVDEPRKMKDGKAWLKFNSWAYRDVETIPNGVTIGDRTHDVILVETSLPKKKQRQAVAAAAWVPLRVFVRWFRSRANWHAGEIVASWYYLRPLTDWTGDDAMSQNALKARPPAPEPHHTRMKRPHRYRHTVVRHLDGARGDMACGVDDTEFKDSIEHEVFFAWEPVERLGKETDVPPTGYPHEVHTIDEPRLVRNEPEEDHRLQDDELQVISEARPDDRKRAIATTLLDALDERDRTALLMRFDKPKRSYAQIKRVCGYDSIGQARQRVSRLMKRLAKRLKEEMARNVD